MNYNKKPLLNRRDKQQIEVLRSRERGLANGSTKVKAPRLLQTVLKAVIPSKPDYPKFKDKITAIKIDNRIIKVILNNGAKSNNEEDCKEIAEYFPAGTTLNDIKSGTVEIHGYLFALGGYLSELGLDILMLFFKEIETRQEQSFQISAYEIIKKLEKGTDKDTYQRMYEQIRKVSKLGVVFSLDVDLETSSNKYFSSEVKHLSLIKIEGTEGERVANKQTVVYKCQVSEVLYNIITSRKHFSLVDYDLYKVLKAREKILYLYIRLMDYGYNDCVISTSSFFEQTGLKKGQNWRNELKSALNGLKKKANVDVALLESGQKMKINFSSK